MYDQNVEMMLMVVFILEIGQMNPPRSLWQYGRVWICRVQPFELKLRNMLKKHMQSESP